MNATRNGLAGWSVDCKKQPKKKLISLQHFLAPPQLPVALKNNAIATCQSKSVFFCLSLPKSTDLLPVARAVQSSPHRERHTRPIKTSALLFCFTFQPASTARPKHTTIIGRPAFWGGCHIVHRKFDSYYLFTPGSGESHGEARWVRILTFLPQSFCRLRCAAVSV